MVPETRRERAGWTLAFMAGIALWLGAFLAIIPGCASTKRELPPIDARLPAMLESTCKVGRDGEGFGTGFVIYCEQNDGSDGIVQPGKWRTLVATAGHVLEIPRPIRGHDAHGRDMGDARAYWNCQFFDMAIMEFDLDRPMPVAKLRKEHLRAGEHVWLCGFPWAEAACITNGYVGDPREVNLDPREDGLPENAILRVVLFGDPGNSGSAVYDDNGEVVGLLTLGYAAPGGLNGVIAMAGPGVREWIDHIVGLKPPYWDHPRCRPPHVIGGPPTPRH